MQTLVVLSVAFVVSHMVLSAGPVRHRLVEKAGLRLFLVLYSVIAIAIFWPMIKAYIDAPVVTVWHPSTALRHIGVAVMIPACLLLVAGLAGDNPSMVSLTCRAGKRPAAHGIYRITRHPVMWAAGLWALCHLLAVGTLSAIVFFGSLAVLGLAGTVHIDHRKTRQTGDAWQAFMAETSSVPFLAIAQGRQRVVWREIGFVRPGLAGVLYALMILLHERVIGLSPLPLPID